MTEERKPEETNLPSTWQSDLDGHYDVRVLRTEKTHVGTLRITDTRDGTVLLEETVSVSYGAVFGPDIADIELWQQRAITVVDALPHI